MGTLNVGGIERLVSEWCLQLREEPMWKPEVLCLIRKQGAFVSVLENAGVPVTECLLKNNGAAPFIFRLARQIRKIRPHVVHSQVAFSMLWQVIGLKISCVPKIIFTQHNEYQNWSGFVARFRIISYFIIARSFIHHYVCVSNRVRSSLSALTLVPQSYFKVIPNGVDTGRFRPRPELRSQIRNEFGVGEGVFLLGTVARFSAQKGHVYLIEACRDLRLKKLAIQLWLIGRGELQEELEKNVKEMGLSETVKFLGPSNSIEMMLPALDCFVLPSLWEGMPISLLEAMACGIPVVATQTSGVDELVTNLENGLMVRVKDSKALSEAVSLLMHDKELQKKLSRQAVETVNRSYSLAMNLKSYLTLYLA